MDDAHRFRKGLRHPAAASRYITARMKGDWYRFKYARRGGRFECGKNLRVVDKLDISGPGTVSLGDNILVEGGPFKINTLYTYTEKAVISIGSNSYLNGIRIGCRNRVEIGRWCISADSRITDNDAHSVYPDRRDKNAPIVSAPVIIEDNVWLCLATVILKNVRIGRNSVVAAGSIVTRDVPPNCVVAGNPAAVVKEFSVEEVSRAEELLEELDRKYGGR